VFLDCLNSHILHEAAGAVVACTERVKW